MKIARYEHAGKAVWGQVEQDRVVPLASARDYGQALALAQSGAAAAAGSLAVADIRWLAPVCADTKIICAGLNYRKHAQEMTRDVSAHASVFPRFPDSFVGHGEAVVRPRVSDMLDYEAELAVVVGKTARYVDESQAMQYVSGYTCMAENSVRDYQMHNRQATPGKNFDRSGAIGPWIVTADDVADPGALCVVGRLNGAEVQRAGIDELIVSIPALVAYLSAFTTLRPGDIIATGTPDGVGMTRQPPRYLRQGDVFAVEIEGVGTLSNPVAEEA